MKYIRTQSGVYELIWDIIEKNDKTYIIEKYDGCVYEEEVLKQSDTIKELCDEFVAVNTKYNSCRLTDIRREKYYEPRIPMYYAGEHTHDFVDDYIKNKGLIYGAIWTDKGLIYVAKMNGKGELELL